MEPGNWIALAGLITTTIIAALSITVNAHNHRKEMERSDKRQAEELQRQEEEIQRMERFMDIERTHKPHIEFCLDANFYGPQQGEYVSEFLIDIRNKGKIQQKITSLKLRIRGIKANEKLEFMEKYPTRLKFPDKLLQAQVIDKDFAYYFVEPDVNQLITFTTKIPESYRFLVVWAEFRYGDTRQRGEGARHSAERIFEIKPKGST
jgi:hypothetical protein